MDRRLEQAAGKRLAAGFASFWLLGMPVPPAGAAEDWRHDRPCGRPHASMVPVQQQGCYRAWCSDTRLGRLCACVREASDDTAFSLGGRNWKAPTLPPMGGDASHFRIDDAGGKRLFVAMLTSESVGIAISNWLVWTLDAGRASAPLQAQNYGTFSFATKRGAGRACHLLAARWHSGAEPGRGRGLYIAGSWYAVQRGEFVRMADRPVIYRRYLSRVERARIDAEGEQRPYLWFRAASTNAPRSSVPLFGPR